MKSVHWILWLGVLVCVIGLAALPCKAEPAAEPEKASDEQAATNSFERRWFIIYGLANLQPELDETEGKINRLINHGLGGITPCWNKPETFADWRDDFKLWDIHLGGGLELTEKLSWYSTVGCVKGTTKTTTNRFPLLLPLETDVKFERLVWFVSSGIDYYPWGKPYLKAPEDGENGLMRRLRGSKPYFEGALGYVHIETEGDIDLKVLFGPKLYRYRDTAVYDLTYLSPRLGVEIPITQKTNLALQAGYLFFTSHKNEYDNGSYYLLFKRYF